MIEAPLLITARRGPQGFREGAGGTATEGIKLNHKDAAEAVEAPRGWGPFGLISQGGSVGGSRSCAECRRWP
jgi:hypothetical protein